MLLARPLTAQKLTYPHTPKVDHVDAYHGEKVADPYRWLESMDSSAVADWVKEQNAVTFEYLGKIPFREKLRSRLSAIWNYPRQSAPWRAGEYWFMSRNTGLQNQSLVYVRKGLDGAERVFLDPNTLSKDGTVALGGLFDSHDGTYMAYTISRSGSDWQEIHVQNIATGEKLSDHITGVKFSGASWHGNGFYYNRYSDPTKEDLSLSAVNERQKVYYHKLGTPQSADVLIHEDSEHPRRTFSVSSTDDERFLILAVSEQGKDGNALYVRDLAKKETTWRPIVETFDDDFWVIDHENGVLLVNTNKGAPRRTVVRIDPAHPEEKNWTVLLPQKNDVLASAGTVGGRLIAVYMHDAHHAVFQYTLDGKLEREITLPTLCTVGGFGGKKEDQFTFYSVTSFTFPNAVYKYEITTGKSTLYWRPDIAADLETYETRQVFYRSKDGTRVPMFLVHKKGLKLDGTNPTLLYAYGGFNASMTPSFSAARLVWLENGGVYAMACLRGGGEYGEEWHKAGTRLRKQNVFDDFIAAAEYLVKEKYTSPSKLAMQGGSNGGLLVGAVANQRPDLFAVALPAVGVMDMLRFHTFTIGWAWVSDYGSSDDPAEYRALKAYSPLHNIRSGVDYPATLVTTADHDDRVVPAHSFKYIATLQEKYTGNKPVLIRIDTKAGHGGGKPMSKIIEETADVYAFTMYHLGMNAE
ncbi:MAG: S9 family peptidase [Ignavibacteriae bacterium]|nr:S9 family peptidase [Ignavibacteriota bacterium]